MNDSGLFAYRRNLSSEVAVVAGRDTLNARGGLPRGAPWALTKSSRAVEAAKVVVFFVYPLIFFESYSLRGL